MKKLLAMLMVAGQVSGSTIETGAGSNVKTGSDKKGSGSQSAFESTESTNLMSTLNVLVAP